MLIRFEMSWVRIMYPASIFLNYIARTIMLVWIFKMDDMDRSPILDSISTVVAQNHDFQEYEALKCSIFFMRLQLQISI